MNPVVREKKRFENALDDSVAGGLNAGTEVLMNQVSVCVSLVHPWPTTDKGGPHHLDIDKAEGILPTRRRSIGSWSDRGVYGGDQVFGQAL